MSLPSPRSPSVRSFARSSSQPPTSPQQTRSEPSEAHLATRSRTNPLQAAVSSRIPSVRFPPPSSPFIASRSNQSFAYTTPSLHPARETISERLAESNINDGSTSLACSRNLQQVPPVVPGHVLTAPTHLNTVPSSSAEHLSADTAHHPTRPVHQPAVSADVSAVPINRPHPAAPPPNSPIVSPNTCPSASFVPDLPLSVPEPYTYMAMPSGTPSPSQPQVEEPSNNLTAQNSTANNNRNSVPRGRGRGRVHSRRGRGRGPRRGRGRGRGASIHRTQPARSSGAEDPTAGWTDVPASTVHLMLEKDYVHTHVSQGARLFCSAAMERLTIELDVKKLKRTRCNVFVLLCDELVHKCCEWLGEFSVLKKKHEGSITVPNIYRYLAVMLFSQCTGCSFSKTLDLLGKLSGQKLNEEILNFINNNNLAYGATGRGEDDSLVWNAQRDQSVMLSQFERSAFRMTARIFLSPNHTILSLDDDLMGTRATDNQVKTISHRKADGEGHVADVLADALFRVVLQMRFRRRHDKLEYCVRKVLSSLLETRGDLSRQGMVVVADRGYAKRPVLNALMEQGLSCFGVMPEFMLKCHPFVGKSYLKIASFVEDEENGGDLHQATEEVDEGRTIYDRPVRFVVEDGPILGPGVKVAKSHYKPKDRGREELTAIAVREYGNTKHSKIVRFMYSMRSSWPESLFTLVAIPYERSFRGYLFTTRDDNGRIVEPDDQTYRSVMEKHLLQCCEVLTVGQRCADWFVMRQFRVTATFGSRIVTCCPALREAIGYEPKLIPFEISEPTELVKGLCKTWFTTMRLNEPMMRGTTNENAVLNYLKRQSYTKALFCVGLLGIKDSPWLASSPDVILMLDMSKLEDPFHADHVIPCTVEIKTSVSSTTVQDRTSIATQDLVVMDYTHPDIKKYIPEDHIGQIVHQAITANVVGCIYVAASESQVMYTTAVMFTESFIDHVATFVDDIVKPSISWAHDSEAHVPLDKYGDDVEDLLLERVPFWKCVNEDVREKGPFMPIRIFRHSAQSYYSKTRGGVDGNYQTRAVLKSSSSSQKWEQKVVTHTFKTILVNAFVSWRMLQKEDLLQTRDSFGDLQKYRQRLNRVHCMTDFVLDTALELLEYAEELSKAESEENVDGEHQNITPQQKVALVRRARKRKRKRIFYFNNGDGLELEYISLITRMLLVNVTSTAHFAGRIMTRPSADTERTINVAIATSFCVSRSVQGFENPAGRHVIRPKKLKSRAPMAYERTSDDGDLFDAASPTGELPDAEPDIPNASPEHAEDEEEEETEERRYLKTRKRLRSASRRLNIDRNSDR